MKDYSAHYRKDKEPVSTEPESGIFDQQKLRALIDRAHEQAGG